MKKQWFLWLLTTLLLGFLWTGQGVLADDVDYSIPRYEGHLIIHEDNTASYVEQVTYNFDSSYNGQYLSLGTGGNMPQGFAIGRTPTVQVLRNGENITDSVRTEFEDLSKGVRLKIYNGGSSGDQVQVTVTWTLTNLLNVYQDVAELNWVPISNWDETLRDVRLTVTTDKSVSESQLWGHRGGMHPKASVTKDGNSYTLTAKDVSGLIELHAYWDRSVVSVAPTKAGQAKDKILATERGIDHRRELLMELLTLWIPLGAILLTVVAVWVFHRAKKRLLPFSEDKGYSFALPSDLSPLLVAKQVNGLELEELSPPDAIHGADIKLENYIQAELLDLIAQGKYVLSSDKKQLLQKPDKALTAYESAFLTYLFGEVRESYTLSSVFDDYQADRKTILASDLKGAAKKHEITARGAAILRRLQNRVTKVDRAVAQAFRTEGLPNYRKPLSVQDKYPLMLSNAFLVGSALCSVGAAAYSLSQGYLKGMVVNGFILIITALTFWYVISQQQILSHEGKINLAHQTEYRLWLGFRHMLQDIKTFDRAELESIIVWEKVLVYATLFGYAKRVQEALTVKGLTLPSEQLASVDAMDVITTAYFSHSLQRISTYSQAANQAVNFNLPSSGGGGGFSGGGGGGGGGAF
ncbi:DUF2207 domain-containing protein [Streptococcus sp. DD12]|uniref:DUF2207 domain-containing protein n=1 Tax=Streptococcus sp. DD12 TaxID=1777880 RepID=UPI000799E579|nr:DUF2207 domain-containing protein [Streptococcus sp. DD12]KXT76007.1 hypothetical protein STRDD12_01119 [Streptococcus sp. DD12]